MQNTRNRTSTASKKPEGFPSLSNPRNVKYGLIIKYFGRHQVLFLTNIYEMGAAAAAAVSPKIHQLIRIFSHVHLDGFSFSPIVSSQENRRQEERGREREQEGVERG